jgi:hypothetical protein
VRQPDTDLVEYVVVAVPNVGGLAHLVPALAGLVGSGTIRILDLVVMVRAGDGAVSILEPEAVDALAALRRVEGEVGGLLSSHDIELTSTALRPGTAALLLLVEDCWARPLSVGAARAGGRVVGGERIPRSRVEASLASAAAEPTSTGPDWR